MRMPMSLSAAVLVSAATLAAQQDCQPVVRASLELSSQTAQVGEPFVVTVKLSRIANTSCQTAESGSASGSLELRVAQDGGGYQSIQSFASQPSGALRLEAPAGFQSSAARHVIYPDAALMGAGRYSLRAEIRDDRASAAPLLSETVEITIAEPVDSLEIAALDHLKEHLPVADILSGAAGLRGDFEQSRMKEFVRLYGETRYGAWARFSLGVWFFHRGEFAAADQQLADSSRAKNFPLMNKAISYLVQAKAALGDTGQAERLLATVTNEETDKAETVAAQRSVIRARSLKDLGPEAFNEKNDHCCCILPDLDTGFC